MYGGHFPNIHLVAHKIDGFDCLLAATVKSTNSIKVSCLPYKASLPLVKP